MKTSTIVRHEPLRPTLLGSAIVLALLGCAPRSTGAVVEESQRGREELEAGEARARRGVDLAALDAETSTDTIAPGLIHHAVRFAEGPWVVHVLDVDLRSCWSAVALKAGDGVVGRARTTDLLESLLDSDASREQGERRVVAAGVNADFFRFSPPGVPLTAHITGGRVIAGPSRRPVVAFDEAGIPSIGVLEDSGFVVVAGDTLPLSAWNRAAPDGLALFDEGWRAATDSATGAVELVVALASAADTSTLNGGSSQPSRRGILDGTALAIDTLPAGVAAHEGQIVLVAGAGAAPSLRARLLAARTGRDSVRVRSWIVGRQARGGRDVSPSSAGDEPIGTRSAPREAVGGFPVLVRRNLITPGLDSAGGRGFGPVRHPRTAVGLSGMGTRLLLVTVDGRQPGYSVGMTLPELARLMLDLGATAALNLDGGGSTTMALSRGPGMTRILNQPSDTSGERPVANALAVVRDCQAPRAEPGNIPEPAP